MADGVHDPGAAGGTAGVEGHESSFGSEYHGMGEGLDHGDVVTEDGKFVVDAVQRSADRRWITLVDDFR